VNKREFLAAGLGLGAARAARSQDKPAVIASKLPTGLFSGATDRRNGFAEGARFLP